MAKRQERLKREARRQLRRQDELIAASLRAAAPVTTRLARKVSGAWRKQFSPAAVVPDVLIPGLEPIMLHLMVAGFLVGWLESQAAFAVHTRRTRGRGFASGPDDALAFLQKRATLDPAEVDRLRQLYGNEAVRVTRRLSDHVEAQVQAAAERAISEGMHVREGARELGEALATAGVERSNPFLAETLFRTQNAIAYSAGRWDADQDPAIQEILWGYEYVTVGDDRVRENHALLDGVRLPKDDARWSEIWPPNGFACRCTVLEVWDDAPAREKTMKAPEAEAVPDKGWEFNAGQAVSVPAAPVVTVPAVAKEVPVKAVAKKATAPKAKKKVRGIPTEGTGKPLTKAEEKWLRIYTSLGYEDIVTAQLGGPMRQFGKLTKEAALKAAKVIERGLKKLPGKTGRAFRGLKFDSVADQTKFLQEFKIGQVHEFQAFQSSSASREVAQAFMSRQKPGQSVLLRIEGKTGRDVVNFSRRKEEVEVLFMRGAKFNVTKIEGNVVHLTEL